MPMQYSIGEFAKMCNVKKDTLFYYDKIGLLKPAYIAENGYRCYTMQQFAQFDVINVLKQSGMPLKEIKFYFENYEAEVFENLLENQLKRLEQEKQKIDGFQYVLKQTISTLQEGKTAPLGEIQILTCPEEYLIATPVKFQTQYSEKASMQALSDHFAYCWKNNFNENLQIGEIIIKEDFFKGVLIERFYYSRMPKKIKNQRLKIKPKGVYAVKYHQGNYESLPQVFLEMQQELQAKGYKIVGDIYEEDVINYYTQNNPSKYILKISMQVCKE